MARRSEKQKLAAAIQSVVPDDARQLAGEMGWFIVLASYEHDEGGVDGLKRLYSMVTCDMRDGFVAIPQDRAIALLRSAIETLESED